MLLRIALIAGCSALQHKYGRETYGARVTRGAAGLASGHALAFDAGSGSKTWASGTAFPGVHRALATRGGLVVLTTAPSR